MFTRLLLGVVLINTLLRIEAKIQMNHLEEPLKTIDMSNNTEHDPSSSPHSNGGGSGTSVTLEINTDYSNAARFPAWVALTVFSIVCLAGLESRKGLFSANSAGEKWALAVFIMSMLFGFMAVAAYLMMRAVFVGQMPELVLLIFLTICWASGLPAVMNPGNDIAVSKPKNDEVAPVVTNANLYFGAWFAFATCIYLTGNLVQESTGVDVTRTPAKTARWYALTASSLVVMGSAVRAFTTSDCGAEHDVSAEITYCRRCKFAVSVGVIGFFLALAMTCLTRKGLTLQAEATVTTLQLILWCFGVGYITFGTSPGSTIGNLFFSTWTSFILTVFLFGQCFREYIAGREAALAQQHGSDHADQQQQHEQAYDDAI